MVLSKRDVNVSSQCLQTPTLSINRFCKAFSSTLTVVEQSHAHLRAAHPVFVLILILILILILFLILIQDGKHILECELPWHSLRRKLLDNAIKNAASDNV